MVCDKSITLNNPPRQNRLEGDLVITLFRSSVNIAGLGNLGTRVNF